MKAADVPVGARIPKALKRKLDRFCKEHGLKMRHVVKGALEDKLLELEEELKDIALVRKRLEDADFASQNEYDRYMSKRLNDS